MEIGSRVPTGVNLLCSEGTLLVPKVAGGGRDLPSLPLMS
jgi:hypothetical protein